MWDVGTAGTDQWKAFDSYSAPIDKGYIFTAGVKYYTTVFQAFKIHSINARWMQAVTNADRVGFNVLSLVHPEFTNDQTDLAKLLASNASVVKPDGNIALVKYKPLEPSEYDWFPMSGKHSFAQALLTTFPESIVSWFAKSKQNNALYGKFIVDIDISMNGHGSGFSSEPLIDERCTCNNCSNPVNIAMSDIADAFNLKYGGNYLLPYLREMAVHGVTPLEYIAAYESTEPGQWEHLLASVLPDTPDAQAFKNTIKSKFPQFMRRSRFDQPHQPTPSPIPSDYDIAE